MDYQYKPIKEVPFKISTKKNIYRLPVWTLLLILPARSTITPHENFKEHMESNIGSSIDKPQEPGVAIPKYLLNSTALPNGNIENGYQYRGTCRYFFEFDPNTRIILGWRFEGSKTDCAIVP